MEKQRIVFLIDHKGRDLMGAALIAHHLEKLGYEVHLEPLQSWRSCLPAWKPSMIIFNHLSTKLLADYSEELHKRGILVAVLLNEGFCLKDSGRKYLSEPQHPNIHCDLFLTWNTLHRDELIKYQFVTPPENAITTGVPRFDFYRQPWSSIYQKENRQELTQVLVNTTFAIAHYYERSEKDQALLIAAMGNGKVDETSDYKKLIRAHYVGMRKLPEFLKLLLNSGKHQITLRPHPREELTFYKSFIENLPAEQKQRISLNKEEQIQSAIITADIILNCEDCTTSVESWMAQKPTITLTFAKDPAFFTSTYAERSPQVAEPQDLIPAIELALSSPDQPEYKELREAYLNKWLFKTDGRSAQRAANAIHEILSTAPNTPAYPKDFSSLRRGFKVRLTHLINEPSHFQVKHWIKRMLFGENCKQSMKYRDYLKAVRPSESHDAVEKIRAIDRPQP